MTWNKNCIMGDLSSDTCFEVLKFHAWNGWNKKKFIGFHKRTPTFLYSWNKTCKTPTGFFQLLFQMTLAKIGSITHRQNRYLPSDARSLCEIACKVNLCGSKWYLPISDTGGTRQFSISKWAVENKKFLPWLADQECQNIQWNLCAEFCAWKKIFYALVRQ